MNCICLYVRPSSDADAVVRGHVIRGLKGQSREEMCRLIISHQILMDQLGNRNPFWLPSLTYVRLFHIEYASGVFM